MEILKSVFGEGEHLTVFQMCCRAIVIYWIALLWIRAAGKRAFGKLATFDNVITILLGAVLSRAVVGVSPFLPIIAASLVIVLLHRAVAWLCIKSHAFGKFIKGNPISLYNHDQMNKIAMDACLVSNDDVKEEIRLEINENSLDKVEEIFMERNGKISVIKKEN